MFLIAMLAGCGSTESGVFTTYNAGLAVGFVPGATERASAVAQAISELDADVVCLQEVWIPDHTTAVQSASSSTFPNAYFPDSQQEILPAPACPDGALDSLLSCATDNCNGACSDELVGCVFDNCPLQFGVLDDDCQRCAMANVGGELQEVVDACSTMTTGFAYGGSFGTGILSKHPLRGIEELVFESTTNRRSMLHAVAELPDGDVDIYCTHLTAAFDSIPYPRPEGSWSEEQTQQIQELRAWIDSTATLPIVAMGDFNVGLAGDDLVAEEPENFNLLTEGYSVPFQETVNSCSFCGDNPLIALGSDDSQSELIDHILFKGWDEPSFSSSLELDQTYNHAVCGVEITGALSDHYAVRVSVNIE